MAEIATAENPIVAPAEITPEEPTPGIPESAPALPETPPEGAGDQPAPEEGTKDEGDFDLKSRLKDLTPEQFDALVKDLPDTVKESSTVLAEYKRRGEQAGADRARAETQAVQQQQDLFDQRIAVGKQGRQWLDTAHNAMAYWEQEALRANTEGDTAAATEAVRNIQAIRSDPTYAEAVQAIADSRYGEVGKYIDGELNRVFSKHADLLTAHPITNDELTVLNKARVRDAQKGTMERFDVMVGLLMERKDRVAYDKGFADGLKDRKAKAELAEKLTGLQAVANQTPERTPAAAGGGGNGKLTLEAYRQMSQAEVDKLPSSVIDEMTRQMFATAGARG